MGILGKIKKSLEIGSTRISGALGGCPVVAPESLHRQSSGKAWKKNKAKNKSPGK